MRYRILKLSWFLVLATASFWPAPSWAETLFIDVSEEKTLLLDGMWARIFPAADGDGWEAFWGKGGDLGHVSMNNDFGFESKDIVDLTGYSHLEDQTVTTCPDGTYFHVASATLEGRDDTAYGFLYSADFQLVEESIIEERNPDVAHNDMAVVCSERLVGAAFMPRHASPIIGDMVFYELNDMLLPEAIHYPEDAADAMGSAILVEESPCIITIIGFESPGGAFRATQYNEDFELIGKVDTYDIAPGKNAFWPQGLIRVGDIYLVAHMIQEEGLNDGNLWLHAFDQNWNKIEGIQLSSLKAPPWGMRPWLSRKDDQLLVTFDYDVHIYGYLVTLDLEAMGYIDPASDGDTTPTPDEYASESGEGGCGCGCGTRSLQHSSFFCLAQGALLISVLTWRRKPRFGPRKRTHATWTTPRD